jgi:hypothetical protein
MYKRRSSEPSLKEIVLKEEYCVTLNPSKYVSKVFEIKANAVSQFFCCLLKLYLHLDGIRKANIKYNALIFFWN